MKRADKEEVTKFIKFSLTGAMNTVVDFGVFALLSWLGAGAYSAQVCSSCAGVLNSYTVNRSWTFTTKEKFLSLQMVRFISANLVLMGVSVLVIALLYGRLGLSKWIAKLLATSVTVVLGFAVNRLWVFK